MKKLIFRKKNASEDIASWLDKQLPKAYIAESKPNGFTKKETFSPSSFGYQGACPRYWYLAFEGAPFKYTSDPQLLAIMLNGTYTHERLQSLLKTAGILVDDEIELKYEDPPIRSFADGRVIIPGRDDRPVLEIKSANEYSFAWRKKLDNASDAHKVQILTYMKILGEKSGVFLYENKNTQEHLFVNIEMDEENEQLINYVFDWMRVVRASWESKKLPERPRAKKVCESCPLKDYCYDEQPDGDVKIPLLKIGGE